MAPWEHSRRWASWGTRLAAATGAAALVVTAALVATPAHADTAPPDPQDPVTVTSDALPTAQINGIVWNQQVVGNTVYVGGEFTRARPAGAAPGTNEVVRNHMLSYDLATGVLKSFAPQFNAQVSDLALSPDGTRLYAAGSFTSVDGQARYRVAAFDTATGALIGSFRPTINSVVNAIAATNTSVYVVGNFSSVNGEPRERVAALNASNGSNQALSASLAGGAAQAVVVAPDGESIVVGGAFTTTNGSSNPGYGLARLDAATGSNLPLPVNTQIRNAGVESAILSLETDGDTFYGTGYHFGGGGNVEGTFASDWATGSLTWVEDCHGDTYSSYPLDGIVYSASHKHYCGNSGGFPQTTPWSVYRATALTKEARGINTADLYGYEDHPGEPSPKILNWYPTINSGTYTGKSQGPWTVHAAGKYVLFGGEFTQVNGQGQQGLVRFTTVDNAPNADGPRLQGTNWPLHAKSNEPGTVRLWWGSNFDRDNETLTYRLYRGNDTTNPPIHTETVSTTFWNDKVMHFTDTGQTPGASVRYRIKATDPFGNTVGSAWITTTIASSAPAAYPAEVIKDGALHYWRLGEASGTTVADTAGNSDMVAQAGVTRGVTGALIGDADTASGFSGTSAGLASTQRAVDGPNSFAVEGWFKTTSTAGGKIVGFANQPTGTSTNSAYDRHVYLNASGQVFFGVRPSSTRTINSSARYNDGLWHHFVASLGPDGMKLYMDGKRVAQRADTTSAMPFSGYWRIGGDASWSGAQFLNGQIDDVAIYDGPLSIQQVDAHYVASGRTSNLPPAPADAYGEAVYDESPDLYWRLNENLLQTTAADSGLFGNTGTYRSGVTRNQTGALVGVASNRAATFNGTQNGLVSSASQFNDPRVFSQELWFKTATTSGGKLIGFGSAQTGQSGSYDRHVYMETNGRLTFGVWTGQANTITTPAAYNDNQWHHMVATIGPAGMALYVDGVLRGTHPQTESQSYTGYWRVGGDTTWGPQPWFSGTIDEVAVYSDQLDAATVAQHYSLGSGAPAPNVAPTASFTTAVDELGLQVDGSASSDADGTVASYAWSWGDGTPDGTGATASHTYTEGGTYTVTLTVTDDDGGTGTTTQQVTVTAPPPNQAPTASFTTTTAQLGLQVDGSASSDADGTLVSHAWSWGDGTPNGTGATASHTYASGGTYTVTLTVTDDDGATGTTTKQVTVTPPPPNQAPTASFTATTAQLAVQVDGSASSDSDGTLVSHGWSWGDGTPDGTGATASHTYAEGGTYTVTLTVTDDDGATGTTTKQVTVTPPAPNDPFAQDAFARTVAGGWGDAPLGGTWTAVGTASRLSVGDGTGRLTAPPGASVGATLGSVASTSTRLESNVSMDRLSTGNSFVTVQGRKVGTSAYGARLRVAADGTLQLHATREVGGTTTALGGGTVTGLTLAPADQLRVVVEVEGTSPTTVRAKVWKVGTAEPTDWRATVTDSTAGLQVAGAVGVSVYHGGTTGNPAVVFGFDDLLALPVGATPPANVPPTAAFTTAVDGLGVQVDGSGSSDPDGTVASHAWSWGDSTPNGTGATASHTYAAAGTYTVTLTVTDDDGATASTTRQVVATAPGEVQPFAADDFARTVAGGWGSASLGGAWTGIGTASRLSVAGDAGLLTLPAGATSGGFLGEVSVGSSDVRVVVSADRIPSGNSFVTLQSRRVGSDVYGGRVRLGTDGSVQVHVVREVGGTTTVLAGGTVTGLTFAAGDRLVVRAQAQGTGPTSLRAKVWKLGTPEPADWRATTTDATAALQGNGAVGIGVYHGGAAGSPQTVFSFDDLAASPVV